MNKHVPFVNDSSPKASLAQCGKRCSVARTYSFSQFRYSNMPQKTTVLYDFCHTNDWSTDVSKVHRHCGAIVIKICEWQLCEPVCFFDALQKNVDMLDMARERLCIIDAYLMGALQL